MTTTLNIHDKLFSLYITEAQINERITSIAQQLNATFKDKVPLFLIVLRGGFQWGVAIVKQYNYPCNIDFIQLSSYNGLSSSGQITLTYEPKISLKDRHVIILEDIVDTGYTMQFLYSYLNEKETASTTLVTLLHKPENTVIKVKIDYCGFVIPNLFVVGYGLDYNQIGRNLNAIYQLAN